jgi:hypothetical protein
MSQHCRANPCCGDRPCSGIPLPQDASGLTSHNKPFETQPPAPNVEPLTWIMERKHPRNAAERFLLAQPNEKRDRNWHDAFPVYRDPPSPAPSSAGNGFMLATAMQALRQIAALRDSEANEPFDEALNIADAAIDANAASFSAAVAEALAAPATAPLTQAVVSDV